MAINLDVHGNTQPLEASVQAAVNRIRKTPIKITVDDKGATQPLGNMKRGADEFSKSMEAANARIIAFGASMAIINGVSDAFKGMVRNVVEVEKALADINVVMGLSAANLDKFSDSLFQVAKETAASFDVAAAAATEYARQGLKVEETLKRTKDALILTRLTGMDSAEAVKSLTAAMNTYGHQIKDTTQLVSKFAAVDVKFAVSAEDFADAIARTGAAAKGAGVDIDELIGLVTAAQQQTARGGKVIGNSFKTIFTRIGRTDTLNQLENLGIAVRDVEGNTLGAKRILTDLANTFDRLSEAQKAQIAQTVGGVFQINILKAVLGDAAKQNGILANATQISASATDEAIDKNEQLRNTMAAMATETGLAIKEVSAQLGEIAIAPGIEKILNIVKSGAEGLSSALGDGEGTGNQFATGFLKGLGNIITGPGLVMIVAVIGKLFLKAGQYARESLTSLIGVSSEAQKQKAIQSSLVNLFSQNAALSKEMLRTDISRTEKERIILGLLKAQVVEANMLNNISKQAATTLYKQGYGASLTPRGKGRAAQGYIPNFAHPERVEAAKGGYAAGSIRSMNMPGEGSVIYNSAEKVKNFKGMSQPAIMPPQSSKAGKNYQQAFGNIHGFDPYAAGGYIPNYARKDTFDAFRKTKSFRMLAASPGGAMLPDSTKELNQAQQARADAAYKSLMSYVDKSNANLTPKALIGAYRGSVVKEDPKKSLAAMLVPPEGYKKPFANHKDLTWPVYGLRPDAQTDPSLSEMVEEDFKKTGSEYGNKVASVLNKKRKEISGDAIWSRMKKTAGAMGAWQAAVGSLFETAVATALEYETKKGGNEQGDFDVRAGNKAILSKAFDGFPVDMLLADFKNDSESYGNKESFYKKVMKEKKFEKMQNKNKLISTRKAYGHIPNFADPLSDAIGREKAAGVPVSQIRVGSHGALMGKGNPLGLGVTNTYDEPNGLRDVFGSANGFVPNYAVPTLSAGDMGLRIDKTQQQLADQYNKELKIRIDRLRKGNYQYKDFERSVKKLNDRYNVSSNAQSTVNKELRKEIGLIQRNNLSRQQMSTQFQKSSLGRGTAKMGKMFSGNFGMMAMMGAPMAAGLLQGSGAGQTGAGSAMYSAGGALQGAATGGMMASMLAPMFGPAAPLVIGIGALGGAIHGMASASEENTKALEENAKNMGGQIAQSVMSNTALTQALSSLNPAETKRLAGLTRAGGEINKAYKERERSIIKKYQTPQDILNPASQVGSMLSSSPLGAALSGFINTSSSAVTGEKKSEIGKARGEMEKQAAIERKKALITAFKSMPAGEEFMAKSLNMVDGKYDLKERSFDREGYSKELEKLDPKDKAAQEALKQIFEDQVVQAERASVNLSKENKAIILRLNLQKAIMLAQMQAKEAQIDIKEKYFKQSNMIEAQTKILGGLMSEEQKARLNYNKSLIKNTETRESGEQAAEDAMRLGILQDIKGAQGGGLEQALKKALFKETDEGKLKDITFENLTKELDAKGAKELLAILTEIGEKDDKANKIHEQRTAEFNNQISILDKQKTLNDNIATADYKINDAIGQRKDLMKDVNREMQEYIRGLDYAAQKRAIESEIQSARFSAGPVRSQEEVFQDMQRKVGERQESIREEYTKSAVTDMKKFADELGLTEQQRLEVANDPNKLKGAAVSFYDKEQSNFNAKYGQKMKMLEEESVPLIEKIGKGEKITDSEMRNLEEYNKLIDLQNNLNSVKEETLKKSGEISGKLQDQLNITKQKINKEAELQAIKEKEYLRKTGPGAFGEGMADASQDMRNEIEMMDYELGRNIPRNFANGMATALTEAINGAKDLDDALRDAAINFLGAIQQAMMQKMAMQAVTAMGFSQGGNVRKYSNGGNVPAMVTNGEYVMGRDAVKKYGGGFMHRMNAGGEIPGYSNGGDISDRKYRRSQMSGYFYSGQSGSIGLKEDEQTVRGLIAERERKRQEEEARRRAKKAKKRQLWGMLGSTVAMGFVGSLFNGNINAGGGLTSSAKSAGYGANTPAGVSMATDASGQAFSLLPGADASGYSNVAPTRSWNPSSWFADSYGTATQDPALSYYFNNNPQSLGGKINKYATGGHISGKSGIDQIPAMLSEGEYVIKASSARQIGKPTLDRINAGKFYEGGQVSKMEESSESGMSRGNTNNINISINVKKGQSQNEQTTTDNNSDPAAKDKDDQDNSLLAEKIKQQVVAVIVEEQRPGGLLDD